jgi:hypothetical protein
VRQCVVVAVCVFGEQMEAAACVFVEGKRAVHFQAPLECGKNFILHFLYEIELIIVKFL